MIQPELFSTKMALETKIANLQAVREDIAASTSSIEEITGVFAQQALIKAGLQDYAKAKPLVVFDGMCREGILTVKLHEMLKERPQNSFEVICGDVNDTMVNLLKQRIDKEGWTNTTVTDKLAPGVCLNFCSGQNGVFKRPNAFNIIKD